MLYPMALIGDQVSHPSRMGLKVPNLVQVQLMFMTLQFQQLLQVYNYFLAPDITNASSWFLLIDAECKKSLVDPRMSDADF
jgi:hypothetical protein